MPMLSRGHKYRFLYGLCFETSLKAAQGQFFCIILMVILICLCIHHRLFLGDGPRHIHHAYAFPKTFITSECGDTRRLGNSMFAYASMMGIAYHNNMTPVVADGIRLTKIFTLSALISEDLENTMGLCEIVEEYGRRGCAFDRSLLKLNSNVNVRLFGYLQSWKYFNEIEADVRASFVFKDDIKGIAQKFLSNVISSSMKYDEKITVVGIHIRRGDMTESYYQQFGYVSAPPAFFSRAMNYFKLKYKYIHFIVCSDDIGWARNNIFGVNISFSVGNTDAVDLAILSKCDHVIISVGSFGWWAGWISNGTVIYYSNWPRPFSQLEYQVEKRDYFPVHWIPLE